MNAAQKLAEKHMVTHTINGNEYECFPWSMHQALDAFGPGAFAVVQDGDVEKVEQVIKPKSPEERLDMIRNVLRVSMYSPRFGDEPDLENNVVDMRLMARDALPLFNAILGEVGEQAAGFPESSPEVTED